mgnify:CR=1 FL=1
MPRFILRVATSRGTSDGDPAIACGDGPAIYHFPAVYDDRLAVHRHRGAHMPWHAMQGLADGEAFTFIDFHDEVLLALHDRLGTLFQLQESNTRMRVLRRDGFMAEVQCDAVGAGLLQHGGQCLQNLDAPLTGLGPLARGPGGAAARRATTA